MAATRIYSSRPACLAQVLFASLLAVSACADGLVQPLFLGDDDRILVLAPHPDDESIAAGGLIQEALNLDLPVKVCFFTMGDNNELSFLLTRKHPVLLPGAVREMGVMRQNEALAATARLGVPAEQVVFLGYPDFGTLSIWLGHWRDVPPYRSMLTRANAVPYPDVLTPGSAYAGEDVVDDLVEVIRDFRPTILVVSHPADHNVDHRALYLFARVALWDLEPEGIFPRILAYPVHFTQWPEPRRPHPMRPATPPHFLADWSEWIEFDLAPYQVETKQDAIRQHRSQYRYSSRYLDSFVRKSEIYGDLQSLEMPGAVGSVERDELDDSQFRADATLAEDLFGGDSEASKTIAGQVAEEMRNLAEDDNAFARQAITGDGNLLALSFQFDKPLSSHAELAVQLFGYRPDKAFGDMPKIEIVARPGGTVSVHDLRANLPDSSVETLPGTDREISIRVPLGVLGSPDRILAGAQLSKGELPVDWTAWRVIDLRGGMEPPPPSVMPSPPLQPPKDAPAEEVRTAPPPSDAAPVGKLIPRVRLPKSNVPDRTEANEPVFW